MKTQDPSIPTWLCRPQGSWGNREISNLAFRAASHYLALFHLTLSNTSKISLISSSSSMKCPFHSCTPSAWVQVHHLQVIVPVGLTGQEHIASVLEEEALRKNKHSSGGVSGFLIPLMIMELQHSLTPCSLPCRAGAFSVAPVSPSNLPTVDYLTWPLSPFWSEESAAAPAAGISWPRLAPTS